MLMITILAMTIAELAQLTVAVGTVVGMTVAVVRWLLKRYVISLERSTAATPAIVQLRTKQDEHADKLDTLIDGVGEFKTNLDSHMEVEESIRKDEYELVQKMQRTLNALSSSNEKDHGIIFKHLKKSEDAAIELAINTVKSMSISDSTPTLIYRTTPGNYELLWHNPAWTEWTGLELDESRAGGDLLAVAEGDRKTVGPTVEDIGQRKEEMDLEYHMINPKTGESIGYIWAHAYPIHTTREEEWFYVSRIKMIDPAPGYERLA